MSNKTWPTWATPGAEVIEVTRYDGVVANLRPATIERVTKTQLKLDYTEDRYKVSDMGRPYPYLGELEVRKENKTVYPVGSPGHLKAQETFELIQDIRRLSNQLHDTVIPGLQRAHRFPDQTPYESLAALAETITKFLADHPAPQA